MVLMNGKFLKIHKDVATYSYNIITFGVILMGQMKDLYITSSDT